MQIQQLTLASPNPKAQANFFAQTFGLGIEEIPNGISLMAGRSRLSFVQGNFPARAHYAFDIPENQFHEAAAWLRERQTILADEAGIWHFESSDWHSDSLYFYDADKNIVELIARHNQPTASVKPFTWESLVSISEIGLVTPNVIETVSRLKQALGLKVWRGAGSETFTAVGDEEGLLIVAAEGRPWRPENVGAKPATIHLKIAGNGGGLRLDELFCEIESKEK